MNAPYNLSSIETPRTTLEEIINYPAISDSTQQDLIKSKKENGLNVYCIAVMSGGIRINVYLKFEDEKGRKPFAQVQACLSRELANGKVTFGIWCAVFEGNSRKPIDKYIIVELKSFLGPHGEIRSYEKVSDQDLPRYEINGIYVSTNEMNEIIRLKGRGEEYKPESFATGKETDNLKVPAKASPPQPVGEDLEGMTSENLEDYMNRLVSSRDAITSEIERVEEFMKKNSKEAKVKELVEQMGLDVNPKFMQMLIGAITK